MYVLIFIYSVCHPLSSLCSVSVPIAKQFLTINEKWVLVKFMKALGTFCV